MRRIITVTVKTIIFLAGFLAAMYIFFPWREAGKFAMTVAHNQLQKNGMRLTYSDVSGEADGFTVNNLTLSGMADISLSSVTVRPEFVASILSLSPVVGITFKDCGVRLGQTMNFGDGGFMLTAGREILLEDLRSNGEFSLDGYISVDPSAMKIANAEARLDVPETFSQNMGMLRNFLPLLQEGDKWYLRRK